LHSLPLPMIATVVVVLSTIEQKSHVLGQFAGRNID